MPETTEFISGNQTITMPGAQPTGCWIAYYSDWSGFAVFGTEIDALRYAVAHDGMTAEFATWGEVR